MNISHWPSFDRILVTNQNLSILMILRQVSVLFSAKTRTDMQLMDILSLA